MPPCGCGTVLGKAARMGLAAKGGELNPVAMILARVYEIINIDATRRAVGAPGIRVLTG